MAWAQDRVQTKVTVESFLAVDKQSLSNASSFDTFLNTLEKKQNGFKNQVNFLQYLFTKTHQQYLKKYEDYATISNLFNSGSYNCLTGTILYSVLLDHFQIPHQVIETNYHIFILAETEHGKILLETTDPVNGFIVNPLAIENKINVYKTNMLVASNSNTHYYRFNFDLFNTVSTKELLGLLYYNKAVDAYNHQNLQESVHYLKEAHAFYSSSRIEEFSQILLLTLQQSQLDQKLRIQYLETVLSIKRESMPTMAYLN